MSATIRIAPEPVERWRPLVAWALALPHLVWSGVLLGAAVLAGLLTLVSVALTGRVPARLTALQALALRQRLRAYAVFFALRRSSPPFATGLSLRDPGDDPLSRLDVPPPALVVPRRAAVGRLLTVAPHALVLIPIGILMDALYPLWMLVAVANRGWPPAAERALVVIEQWAVEVILYVSFTDGTPPQLRIRLASPEPAVAT